VRSACASHTLFSLSQFIKVHACGGRNAGRHKKSFQRLPGTDGAPPARPAALSAAELRTALAASPPPAAAKRPLPASPAAAAPPAKASRTVAPPPRAVEAPPAQDDAWTRMFRRAAGVEAVDDVSDAEEPPPEEPEEPPPVAPPAPSPPLPPPRIAPPVARARVEKAKPPPRPASPAERHAPLTEAELETALEAERETQRRVLVRACVGWLCVRLSDTRAPLASAQASMGIVFDEAPAAERPAPRPASSSDDDGEARPESLPQDSDDSGDDVDAAPARRGAALVSDDQGAWARALRQAAGEDEAAQEPADAPAPELPPAGRKAAGGRETAAARPRKKAAPSAAPPAERKGVEAALQRTRLGEGRQGVYFADTAFDWRDLAVNPAQQTWSLLGGGDDAAAGADDTAPHEAADWADDAPPAPEPLAAPLPSRALPSAPLAAVNLHTLGASFMQPQGDDSMRSAWEANREALAVDFKNKRRQATRRAGKPGAPPRG
jgi:hypothetical protein